MTETEAQAIRTLIYKKNKILFYISLDPQIHIDSPLSPPTSIPILAHHYHYPCIYYERIYKHFKQFLPSTTSPSNITIFIQGVEIPYYRPIGLYVKQNSQLIVKLNDESIQKPFKIVYRNWKQALCILIPQRGAYDLMKATPEQKLKQYFSNYLQGRYNTIPKSRVNIALRGFFEGEVVQRFSGIQGKVRDLVYEIWPSLFSEPGIVNKQYQGRLEFKTHGIELNLEMPSLVFYENFDYNDGYCYISLEILK